jgi:hypothetical protein
MKEGREGREGRNEGRKEERTGVILGKTEFI